LLHFVTHGAILPAREMIFRFLMGR